MDLSPIAFRPADDRPGGACRWADLLAPAVARQGESPTARTQARLLARAARPDGAFARRVASALAAERGMNAPFTPPFQPVFKRGG